MNKITLEEITEMTKKEAEIRASESIETDYTTHLVPVYVVIKTNKEGRIGSYTSPCGIPMGNFLVEGKE